MTTMLVTAAGGHGWDFAVGKGVIYRADDDFTSVSEWTGGSSWTVISNGTGPVPEVESRTSHYGVTYDPTGPTSVDLYSGSGTAWTVIGGPADPALAAGD